MGINQCLRGILICTFLVAGDNKHLALCLLADHLQVSSLRNVYTDSLIIIES